MENWRILKDNFDKTIKSFSSDELKDLFDELDAAEIYGGPEVSEYFKEFENNYTSQKPIDSIIVKVSRKIRTHKPQWGSFRIYNEKESHYSRLKPKEIWRKVSTLSALENKLIGKRNVRV